MSHCNGEDAVKKAEALRKTIEDCKPVDLNVTASFGVAELPLDVEVEFSTLFNVADEAEYKAKEMGRNKVFFKAVEAEKKTSAYY